MFPIEGENNKRWENISTIIFLRGVRLRLRSKGTAGLFKKVKTKDMGVFLTLHISLLNPV
jgi:hypothetical protein